MERVVADMSEPAMLDSQTGLPTGMSNIKWTGLSIATVHVGIIMGVGYSCYWNGFHLNK